MCVFELCFSGFMLMDKIGRLIINDYMRREIIRDCPYRRRMKKVSFKCMVLSFPDGLDISGDDFSVEPKIHVSSVHSRSLDFYEGAFRQILSYNSLSVNDFLLRIDNDSCGNFRRIFCVIEDGVFDSIVGRLRG